MKTKNPCMSKSFLKRMNPVLVGIMFVMMWSNVSAQMVKDTLKADHPITATVCSVFVFPPYLKTVTF